MTFDGKAFGAEVARMVKSYVSAAIEPITARIKALEARAPERGEKGDPGEPGEKGANGAPGRDGADGKDGADGPQGWPGEKGDPGPGGEPGARGADGPAGKDGVGLAGALIDREGTLVITLTDGTARALGPVVGKDGAKGDAGKDGTDGFGFDDLEVIHDGARGFTFRFTKGERVKDFAFTVPVVLDRGVYKDGQAYEAGDGVTWGGSFWIAQEETAEKPGDGKSWRLSIKKGRDGKDGVVKPPPDPKPLKVG